MQDASGGERGWQRSGQGWGVQGWAEQGSCVVERAGRGVWYGLARGWRVGDAWGLRAKWAWEGLGCGSGSRDERRWGPRGDVRRSDGRISRGWSSGAGDRGGAAGGRDDGVGERRGGGVGDGGGAASGESTSNGAGSSGDATHANYGAVPWLFKATPQALHPYWHLMRLDKVRARGSCGQHSVASIATRSTLTCTPTGTLFTPTHRPPPSPAAHGHVAPGLALHVVHHPGMPSWPDPRLWHDGAVRCWGGAAEGSGVHRQRPVGQVSGKVHVELDVRYIQGK